MDASPRWLLAVCLCAFSVGCGYPGEDQEDARRSSQKNYEEALALLASKDRAAAELKFTAAIDGGGLNPDAYTDAAIKRAVCWSGNGKADEALAMLQSLESGGGPPDTIESARSYILAKQGKAAESRAALAKARRLNPKVQEFKD